MNRYSPLRVLALCYALLIPRVHGFDWQPYAGYRSAALPVSSGQTSGFERLAGSRTGIVFTNQLPERRYLTNQVYLNGSGVAAGDIDGDGNCDLYFSGLDNRNALYRNLGNWRFEEMASQAGVDCPNLVSSGAVFADLDGDGDLDLVVNSVGGGTHLFFNDGKGRFKQSESANPLNAAKGGTTSALADIDGDGDLDLYVANYRSDTVRDQPNTRYRVKDVGGGRLEVLSVNGRPVTEPDLVGRFVFEMNGRVTENGEVDVFFRNEGQGRFTPVSFTGGTFLDESGNPITTPPYDWGLTVGFRDINGDLLPDIYVCNDFEAPDRIWINEGNWRFRAIAPLALRKTSRFSMGIDFADLNRDGHDEFFVADMLSRDHVKRHLQVSDVMPVHVQVGDVDSRLQYSHNTLFLNRGDGTYAEISQFSRVEASEWSWTPIFLDVDLDGFEDLLITTGHQLEMMHADVSQKAEAMKAQRRLSAVEQQALRKMFPRLNSPNVAFRNRGDLTFDDASEAWGFADQEVSHGMALADLDNDGDLDVVMNNLNGAAGIYRNESGAARVAVRLKGTAPNTQGIGAKIRVLGGPVTQSQEVISGGRYLSGDDPMRVFAAGNATNKLRIEVTWRNGKQSVIADARANHVYEIDESSASEAGNSAASNHSRSSPGKAGQPLFTSIPLDHTHTEELFDDFGRQPLLPNRLSQLGPGICWHDIDADGWDDLIIGSGRGGQLGVLRNNTRGALEPVQNKAAQRPAPRDQTTVLGFGANLLVGSSNYEDGQTNGGWVRIYDLQRQVAGDSILGQTSSTGPLAMADIDADGDLDLFVGGRSQPGRYGEPAGSMVVKNESGRFIPAQRFDAVGMVSGATFSDLNGDGLPELLVACDWGSIKVFANQAGQFREITEQLGLAQYKGLWNGIATADLDGDGQMEIIATNWGLNTHYRASREKPYRLYYADLDGNGTVDLVESYFEPSVGKQVPDRGLRIVGAAVPYVTERVTSFEAYGRAGVKEIFGPALDKAPFAEINTLESMVFWNRNGTYEGRPLPLEAQLAPAFGISVGDLDGDGHEDLFLSQNFFAVNPDRSRNDAGRGLMLRGDGKGGLTPVAGQESGLKIYGEQRGCALSDFDHDGRVDLAVTQNGAATILYRNTGAQPGLRVRLAGGPMNPNGIGAMIRLRNQTAQGPAREVRAGSGYWSQDSSVQVMRLPQPATEIVVRWPGGKTTTTPIPPDAKEVVVKHQ